MVVELQNRFATLQGSAPAQSVYSTSRDSFTYDIVDDYTEASLARISTSDPSSRRSQLPIHGAARTSANDRTTVNDFAGLMFDQRASRNNSTVSGRSNEPAAFNQSAPLGQDETMSTFSDYSGTGSQGKKDKIQPDSSVRVYGRGE